MDDYQDSQPEGPEPDAWTRPTDPGQPHGYIEPSKWRYLGDAALMRHLQWKHLLADMTSSDRVWWARLMRFLRK